MCCQFSIVLVDVAMYLAWLGMLHEMLCADDFVLTNGAIVCLRNNFRKLMAVSDSSGLKVIFDETNVIVI